MLHRMLKDHSGSVAPIFALSIIPVLGFVGAAVDYSRANSVKASMQSALDSTALMLSKDAPNLNAASLQQKAHDYFFALFSRPEAQNVIVNAPVYTTTGGSQLTLSVSGSIKPAFMRVIGYTQLNIGSSATVKWGNNKLRVALALDNTGSMNDSGKIGALKTATHNLLNSLQNAATKDGDVYVSIVPFSRDVNAKLASNTYSTANWIDWQYWDAANGSCSKSSHTSQSTCTGANGTWTPNNHNTWNGCVTDRDQNNDGRNTTPVVGSTSTMFPAEQYSSCPVSLVPQTYAWTTLSSKVDTMGPNGNTNQTIGLAWAWQSLTDGSPLSPPPIDPNDTIPTRKYIILLTDGLNTQNRWTTSVPSIDARMQLACDNVKAAGITLYTVQVNTGGDPTSTLLQGCASPDSASPQGPKFFLLTDANEVVTTFNQIGTQLSQLRLAQ